MTGRAYASLLADVLGWRYIPAGAAARGWAPDRIMVDETVPVVEWRTLGRRAKAVGLGREYGAEIPGVTYPRPVIIDDPVRPGPPSPRLAALAVELVDKARAAHEIGQLAAMWGEADAPRLNDYAHALAVRDLAPAAAARPEPGPVWWPRQHGKRAAVAPVWPYLGAHMRRAPAAAIAAALATSGGEPR